MGQGHYTALIWGVTGDDCRKVEVEVDGYWETAEWADDSMFRMGIKSTYESRVPWLGAFVGCSDSLVSERRSKTAAELEYTAMTLASVATTYKDEINAARQQWEAFRRLAVNNGVDLPEGQLLLVFDYD